MSTQTVALDIMGGDIGPSETVPAAVQALSLLPQLHLVLVGDQHQTAPLLQQHGLLNHPRIRLVHASQVVGMGEKPIVALRTLKDSSMRVTLDLVKSGAADACVSAGNTGALMAMAKCVLKSLPGVDRPALIKALPTVNGKRTVMLDLGANVSCDADTLLQFAVMGAVVAEKVEGIASPRVALLNVGEEEIKGNDLVRHSAELLRQCRALNFAGFIEGDRIFSGDCDVIVCDGFVGNVALKTAEGVVRMMAELAGYPRKKRSILGRLAGFMFKRRFSYLNPDQYNGASLLGLRGIVVKSHGRAERRALCHAILLAAQEAKHQLPLQIADRLESVFSDRDL
ncbi:phosphate acyltransferase PlsX [Aeromonas taiwanensis]|uniref:Phosphate acyltransferase n=1 Tax=Aeromonas taiwanensis TaxID=633417 RepID=A0A5F0KFN1_9GAMM|nr:phosphate acyltransferase PlsX [Aeromonas taiwanensis]TFF80815.1 phosphate acyltransferase PlsX [Aeromonas taiwanensis]TFF81855.1 phosphate acyltransferase PlsX [Aeromonas taiwanensis]TFF83340.1 phosphate acyltransferase PlsX [Aeromonas taiwanensis]